VFEPNLEEYLMGRSALTIVAILAAAFGGAPAPAHASEGWAINGTYTVTSNGQWAKTNDVYRDEAVVKSTWTITSTCSSVADCAGQVISDQGWTAPIYTKYGEWRVERTVKNWEPCADGTAADGHELFRFYPVDDRGQLAIHGSTTLGGEDKTVAPSGACGRNTPLVITVPLKLTQIA
jgi:hypothetical protein